MQLLDINSICSQKGNTTLSVCYLKTKEHGKISSHRVDKTHSLVITAY